MRSNGLSLVLAALMAPAAALAQETQEAPAEVSRQEAAQEAAPSAGTIPQPSPASQTGEMSAQDTGAATDAAALPEPANDPAIALPQQAQVETDAPEPVAPEPNPAEVSTPEERAATGTEAPGQETPQAPPPPTTTTAEDEVLDAEQAFEEIYGQEYDPLADPGVPAAAAVPGTYDPWEKYNRKMHRFNNAVDRAIARPLARGYVKVVPRPIRLGVSNFFSNLGQPVTALNSLLQGKPKQAGQVLGRFVINTTIGIGGLFDPATRAKLPRTSEDFGQTLGVWGWKRSRYVELPLFGPRTVRDVFGMVGDAPLSPLRSVEADNVRIPLQGLQLVDVRSQLLSTDALREGAEDDYSLVRDAWSQRRDYQIFGDRVRNGEDLPDYLKEGEPDTTVPVDAIPVTVPGN